MASQGANNGSSFSSDSTEVDWVDPSNAQTSDSNYTTVAVAKRAVSESANHISTGFGFTIPVGATIDGIVLEIQRKFAGAGGSVTDISVTLTKDGSSGYGSTADSNSWTTSLAYYTWGSSTNKWGQTWTVSEINDANFGAMFSATVVGGASAGCTAYVDHVRITVYYTSTGRRRFISA